MYISWIFTLKTRMHSSRMRTARSSSRLLGEGVSASVHAGIHTRPRVWAWRPSLGVGLETPPSVSLDPWVWDLRPPPSQTPQLPHWVWAWRPLPPGQTPQPPPWVWAWRPARHAGIPSLPVNRMTDTCKNITFANFVCGR